MRARLSITAIVTAVGVAAAGSESSDSAAGASSSTDLSEECVEAIDYARDGFDALAELVDVQQETFDLMKQAVAEAAETGNVSPSSVERIETWSDATATVQLRAELLTPQFERTAEACTN